MALQRDIDAERCREIRWDTERYREKQIVRGGTMRYQGIPRDTERYREKPIVGGATKRYREIPRETDSKTMHDEIPRDTE